MRNGAPGVDAHDGRVYRKTMCYHKAYNVNMGLNMFCGFLVNLLAVALLFWFLLKMNHPSAQTIILAVIAGGLIGY
jgi:hypothetical protein